MPDRGSLRATNIGSGRSRIYRVAAVDLNAFIINRRTNVPTISAAGLGKRLRLPDYIEWI